MRTLRRLFPEGGGRGGVVAAPPAPQPDERPQDEAPRKAERQGPEPSTPTGQRPADASVRERRITNIVAPDVVSRLARGIVSNSPTLTATVQAPFTGESLASLPQSMPGDVQLAFEEARKAQPAWARKEVRERAAVFRRFHDLVLERQSSLLDLIQIESGKARSHAFEEVLDVAAVSRHYAHAGPGYLRRKRRAGALPIATQTYVYRRPKGVVGIISPWNYPLTLSVSDAIPALIAGNAVVLKPDTQGALTALRARELALEAGLPAPVWQVVVGDGPIVGPAVVDHADFVAFTGSTRTGRTVAGQAALRLVGSSLELGGKNAMVVLDDANVERAADVAVRACFSSAGQLCVSIERIFVHYRVYEAFMDRFLSRVHAMRLGAGLDWEADMGSLVSDSQLSVVVRHVEDARVKGAKVVAGGRARPDIGPLFFEPTVLTGVRENMAVAAEETFGPVVSVASFRSEDEAVERANATRYGLNASVWTRDGRRAQEFAARLIAGTVNVNDGYTAAWGSISSPMGGMRDSGLGRRHGVEGIHRFTEAQTVATQRLVPIAPAFGMSAPRWARVFSRAMRLMKALRLR